MTAYITKDKHGLVQLWNNKPYYNEVVDMWIGWKEKGRINEVAIDVTDNNYIRSNITFETSPKEINLKKIKL